MKSNRIACATTILVILLLSHTAGASNGSDLAAELRQIIEQNVVAFNQENVAATLDGIHTKSPQYGSTQEALAGQFEALDMRTELVSFQYIGHDNEFAVARVKLKSIGESEEPFADNIMDTITMFHQEDGVWKYWSNYILGVELIE